MAANHNGRNYRRAEQPSYGGYNSQMRNMSGSQGPQAQMANMFQQQMAFAPQMAHPSLGGGFMQAPNMHDNRQNAYAPYPMPAYMPYGMQPYGMQPMMPHHQQMMNQQQQQQAQQPHQMTSHSSHSSPTPPIHQQQQQQQQQQQHQQQQPAPQQQQQPPHQPKPAKKSAAIRIVDPNTNKEVDLKQELTKKETIPPVEPVPTTEQDKAQRNLFRDQVRAKVDNPVKSAPTASHTPSKIEPRVPTPVDIKKPAKTDTPAAESAKASPPASEPVKTITPKSILPRSNSQTEEKTPEKQGIEISVQTTPSLKKSGQKARGDSPAVPSPPKFDSPPAKTEPAKPAEATPPEPMGPPKAVQPVETEAKQPEKEIKSASEKKLDGETIIIDSSEVKVKEAVSEVQLNGVSEKKAEKVSDSLTIDIPLPNGQEIVQEDILSSEESSECKDQFETPPATPSEVLPEVHEPEEIVKKVEAKIEQEAKKSEEYEKPAEPVKRVEPVKPAPVEAPKPAAAAAPFKPAAVEASKPAPAPKPAAVKASEPAPVKPSEPAPQIVVKEPELEEGEIIEEKPKGRLRYSRDEMVALREAQDKPLPGVPKYECIMDKPILKSETPRPRSNNQFVPAWEQQGSRNRSRGGDRGGDNRNRSMDKNHSSSGGGGGSMKPRIIDHVMVAPVTRKKSANAWQSKREDDISPVVVQNEDKKVVVMRKLRGSIVSILNKITPQNFKELSITIMSMNIDTMEKLDLTVEIIFEKAVLEPAFSQTYANLCKVMGCIKFPEEQNPKVSPFRKTLLNRCQKEFFREKSDEDALLVKIDALNKQTDLTAQERHRAMEELLYLRTKLKKKMLGNINFIGELFNLSMISSKIIITQCIKNLLDKQKDGTRLDDESIECLAKLFTTVGQKLENESNDEAKKALFQGAFNTFKSFATDKNYMCRIRFKIQDVVDLRDNNWVPRRIEAKPQRIEDIHREHAREEQEKKMEAAVAQQSRKTKSRNDSRDDRDRGRGSRDGRMDKSDWNPPTKKIATNIDMSKLSGANQKLDSGSLILGPSRQQWGRGSGTGSGANSPLSGSREDLTVTNRFDMLKDKKNLLPGRTSSAPAPRGKSSDRERSAAIASAMAISSGGHERKPRTPSHSPVRRNPEKKDQLSDDEIRLKTKSILMEYFDTEEIEEAVACVKEELQMVKKHNIFVEEAINLVMEAKSSSIKRLGDLFATLFSEKPPLMNADGLLTGFQLAFESAQDLAIDVPGIYSIFGKLLGKSYANEHVTLKLIKGAMGPLKQSGKAGDVLCEIITNALDVIGAKGRMEIQQRWGKEKMTWSEICDNHHELIEKYKLDFLSSSSEPKESADSGINISENLRTMLEDDKSKDDIFCYVDKTINPDHQKDEPFIKNLVTAICDFTIDADPSSVEKFNVNETKFKKVSPILTKYLQSSKDNLLVELHALDAVQLLVHEKHHPQALAYSLFCKLEDDDIITEQGFRNWRDNGVEQQGHGVMRAKLKQFFEDLSRCSGDESDTNSENVQQ